MDKKPIYKRKWFIVLVVIISLLVFWGIIGSLDDSQNDNTPVDGKATTEPTSIPTNTPNLEEHTYIGEEVSNANKVIFRVDKVDNVKQVGEGYFAEKTDNNFIVVYFTIINNSSESYEQNPLNCILMNSKDAEFEYYSKCSLSFDNYVSSIESVNPGLSKSYVIVFETSTKSTEENYRIKFKDYGLFSSKFAVIDLINK